MALVHQRFKRVFYAFRNPVTGALGGVYRLHGEKSLNHHYNVFQVSVPETYLNGLSGCCKNC
jgi:tRNA-specific adenosine deaminase 3